MPSKQSKTKLTTALYNEIPEFEAYAVEHIDSEFLNDDYLVFGPLRGVLTEWILTDAHSELINKCYRFINQLCDNSNHDVETMLKVTFFERLIDYKRTIEISNVNLTGNALSYFESVLNGAIFEGGRNAK